MTEEKRRIRSYAVSSTRKQSWSEWFEEKTGQTTYGTGNMDTFWAKASALMMSVLVIAASLCVMYVTAVGTGISTIVRALGGGSSRTPLWVSIVLTIFFFPVSLIVLFIGWLVGMSRA